MNFEYSRRSFLQTAGVAGVAAAVGKGGQAAGQSKSDQSGRRFRCTQIDVFTSRRLEGNPLAVFTDARGLSDEEMQGLARETNLQETTFVLPRDAATEQEQGVKVRIFVPEQEIPFGGHPTLGTAMVLRNLRLAAQRMGSGENVSEITLDLKVGRVPVSFRTEESGNVFGEMHQVDPYFGPVHDRDMIASLLNLPAKEIATDGPIQTLSTGLYFVIVPIKSLATLQRLTVAPQKAYDYLKRQKLPNLGDFYYVTRDTGDPSIGLRTRGLFAGNTGEDPATGSASGCTAAWMVKYGIAQSEQTVHILQGVEIKRPSHIFVRASKAGDTVKNVRVGGHAVPIMEGTFSLGT